MRYYADQNLSEITRDLFEEKLISAIKQGRQFTVKGIAKDAFMLSIGNPYGVDVTDEQAGRLFANIISQVNNAIANA